MSCERALCRHPSVVSVTRSLVPSVVAPECVVSLTSWSVRGAGWFWLWALDLVEVLGGRACGETLLLMWLLGVSRGDTSLFLPDLLEVRDVGACVVRLWFLVVAPVFRELLCLGGYVPRVFFHIVLLWPDPGCGSWRCSSCFRMCLTPLVLRESCLA
ncbi:hypothetical protein Taro_011668 [Colocasia esculenta]|uniref:Uncharacterized protein n=1 Tax=Colocasia esculenta TaxID=4460 RepID=A0A843U6T9_COLES|nr:hypothetical protein [Colocasia esculenta]